MTFHSAGIINADEAPPPPPPPVHRYPADEGSYYYINDAVGDATLTYPGQWINDSAFTGGTAPNLDGVDDSIDTTAMDTTASFTYILRVRAGDLGESSPNYRTLWYQDRGTFVAYDVNNNVWRLDSPRIDVSEPQFAVEDTIHYVVLRVDDSAVLSKLDIYDYSKAKVGGGQANTIAVLNRPDRFGAFSSDTRWWTGEFDNWLVFDSALSDQAVETVLADDY